MYANLIADLQAFYFSRPYDPKFTYHNPILDDIEAAAVASGETSAYRLKAIQYRVIAEKFPPKLFKGMPFYYEMATKNSWCDGGAHHGGKHPGGWLMYHNEEKFRDYDPVAFDTFSAHRKNRFYSVCGPYYDEIHYCFPFTNALQGGLKAIYERATQEEKKCTDQKQKDFFYCAKEGLLAVKRIAERFGEEADRMLKEETLTDTERAYLQRISETARRVPWEAPQTFYEALNSLAFLRDVSGSLEGIGQNAFGRPDKYLKPFYDRDIANGTLTKQEAKDLVTRFLLIWDSHHNKDNIFEDSISHEFEISVNLGGCDEDGNEVFNEITEMFISAHDEHHCIYPKLLCRYSANSSKEYLALINQYYLAGRSNILLVNDDSLIPALVRSGKELKDARNYVSAGCWDVIVEGCEKKPFGEMFSLLRPLEVVIHNRQELLEGTDFTFSNLESAQSFEEFYQMVMADICQVVDAKCKYTDLGRKIWSDLHPSPIYSICTTGCLEGHGDYTAGTSKYNQGAHYFMFFADLVNSLLSMKTVCFDEKRYSVCHLFEAMRNNWEGFEEERQAVMSAPFFGDESDASKEMTRRVHEDLADHVESITNLHGGTNDIGYLNYNEYYTWAPHMKATPDGRKDGDALAHGIEPSRFHPIESPTALINSVSQVDFERCAGNSVVNIVLPNNLSVEDLDAFVRAMAKAKLQSIQLNCVNKEDLLDAQIHPEDHQDIIVRMCGFSAKFVSLSPRWQEEFINRNFYSA